MEVFKEFNHFDIFLHIDVLEIFNFNYTKEKTTLFSMHGEFHQNGEIPLV